MALVHADFPSGQTGIYSTDESLMLDGIYAQVEGVLRTDPDGISGGNVLSHDEGSNNSNVPWRFVLPNGAETTAGVALRFWVSSLPNLNFLDQIIRFIDLSNNNLAYLTMTTTGALSVVVVGGSTYTSTVPNVTAGGWYHIEMKYTHGTGALCSFEVRVEGVTIAALTQTDVAGTNSSIYQVGSFTNRVNHGYDAYTKDLAIWTGSGSYNNNFLGSVLVTTLIPSGDISLNWQPSSGTTGYQILDNIPPVDSIYIYADNTYPAAYVGTLTDLPTDVTSVKGLITTVRAAKSDGGDGSFQVGLISDAAGTPTTGLGADRPITTTPTYWRDVFEIDPDTSAAWLPAAVNAVELQLNRTT